MTLLAIASSFLHKRLVWVRVTAASPKIARPMSFGARVGTFTPVSFDWQRGGCPMSPSVLAAESMDLQLS